MAVYYKFKSAKEYSSLAIDAQFISVANLKHEIFRIKHLGRGTDFDLKVSNAQTNQEYVDEAQLIPKDTSVIVCRVPGLPRMPIIIKPEEMKTIVHEQEDIQHVKSSFPVTDTSAMRSREKDEWDDFGDDLYTTPEVMPIQSSNIMQDCLPPNKIDEDSKIKTIIESSALDWQGQVHEGFAPSRSCRSDLGGRMVGGRSFGHNLLEKRMPPLGYICHRCKVPGHFIQHCPTNGDPEYDIKRMMPSSGISNSMLEAIPGGSYPYPVNIEAAFETEAESLPSTTQLVSCIPPELRCPLCKEVMKDAVFTTKCCYRSFCDKCIRHHITSKLTCVCGAMGVLADDVVPNETVRVTITRLMESNNSSSESSGRMLEALDMKSAQPAESKAPSPILLAVSNGEQTSSSHNDETLNVKENAYKARDVSNTPPKPHKLLEKAMSGKVAEVSEANAVEMEVKGPISQESALVAINEVQHNTSASETGKNLKKKKVRSPLNGDMQWRGPQDNAAGNCMMPFSPSAYNPFWRGMQFGMEGFITPYTCTMPYMGYVPGPFGVPDGGMLPQHPFGGQGYSMPVLPPRDFAMSSNPADPAKSRTDVETQKANLSRKREMEQHVGRNASKGLEFGREVSNTRNSTTLTSKHRLPQPSSDHYHCQHQHERATSPDGSHVHHIYHHRDKSRNSPNHHHHHRRSERESSLSRPRYKLETVGLGRRRESHDSMVVVATAAVNDARADKKQKASVSSRDEAYNKRKLTSENYSVLSKGYKDPSSAHNHRVKSSDCHLKKIQTAEMTSKSNIVLDDDSSDDERHFKRKRKASRYDPTSAMEGEDVLLHSQRSNIERLSLQSFNRSTSQVSCF